MSYNYLDKTGLTHLWDRVKAYITKKTIPLIEGTQTASTSAWTGAAPFSTLEDGQVINYYLPFASTNTAVTLNLTLNDGTTTGALPVYYNNSTERMTTHFGRGYVVGLMYRSSRINSSGTTITNSWYHISDRDTVDQQTLRIENGSMVAGTNGVINYGLCAIDSAGRYQSFVTTNGTGTSKTVNTSAKFRNPMIMCRNTANTKYTNGQEVGTGYNSYYVQRFDARYSCNGYGNFTKNTPTYLECTKDSDGYLSVTSNVLVQTFQSGKYYVYVGHSCRDYAYYLQLQTDHPTFYYNGTNLIPEADLKQDKLTAQTAYTSKGSATKVPQITTNTLGQVTGITEVTITQPTVNNGTLTIQKNGTNVQTFTANQSTNVTANIAVPTATSDLTNDSDFTTQTDLLNNAAFKQAIVELIYPVGSLYITDQADTDHDPNNLFPGTTWLRTCIGRALTGALDSNYTSPIGNSVNTFGPLGWNNNWSNAFQVDTRGGQYVHTLTTNEIPAHTHSTYIGGSNGSGYVGVNGSPVGTKAMNTATSAAGGGAAHPIIQAYETYMIWRRTA